MNQNPEDSYALPADCAEPLFNSKFIRVFDLHYAEGKHYYDATRHDAAHLTALQSTEEIRKSGPDAVSCTLIVKMPGEEPRLYLQYEFRYPAGHYLLSVPAGLIDPEDRGTEAPLIRTAVREIREETGILLTEKDRVFPINPFVFSTPGMTDESNGLVCAVAELEDLSCLNHKGAVGSEKFSGYRLLTKKDAMELIERGADEYGMYYPVYTLLSLLYFVSGMWERNA